MQAKAAPPTGFDLEKSKGLSPEELAEQQAEAFAEVNQSLGVSKERPMVRMASPDPRKTKQTTQFVPDHLMPNNAFSFIPKSADPTGLGAERRESITDFLNRVQEAKLSTPEGTFPVLEVEPDLFDLYGKPLNETKSFWFQGVRVFKIGEAQKLLSQENVNIEDYNFGNSTQTIDSKTTIG